MPQAGSYILVLMLDRLSAGGVFRRKRLEWPLHVTVVPWFQSNKSENTLVAEIKSIIDNFNKITLTIGDEAAFGVDGSVPVSLIQESGQLKQLHESLLKYVEKHGAINDSYVRWVGTSYRPHVTHHGEIKLVKGTSIGMESITLVRLLEEDICEVVTEISLVQKGNL